MQPRSLDPENANRREGLVDAVEVQLEGGERLEKRAVCEWAGMERAEGGNLAYQSVDGGAGCGVIGRDENVAGGGTVEPEQVGRGGVLERRHDAGAWDEPADPEADRTLVHRHERETSLDQLQWVHHVDDDLAVEERAVLG